MQLIYIGRECYWNYMLLRSSNLLIDREKDEEVVFANLCYSLVTPAKDDKR